MVEETSHAEAGDRSGLSADELRRMAGCERNARVARRMLGIANALEEMSRADAARLAGMDRQPLPDWVTRYNEAGVEGWRTAGVLAAQRR